MKNRILEALLNLMNQSSTCEITIVNIVNTANVSRSTFYRHFSSVESVLDYKIKQIEQEFIKDYMSNKEEVPKNIHQVLCKYYGMFTRNRYFFTSLKLGQKTNKIDQIVRHLMIEFHLPCIANLTTIDCSNLETFCDFFSAGVSGLIKKWITENSSEDRQRELLIFQRSIEKVLLFNYS